MVAAFVRMYRVALSLYPEAFRRRYAEEMQLDFEDALQEALNAGAIAALLLMCRQTVDLGSSLIREWSRGSRPATTAATTAITVALWALALRPWAWMRDIQPLGRSTLTTAPVDVWELFVIAIVAMAPVVALVMLAAPLVHYRKPKP